MSDLPRRTLTSRRTPRLVTAVGVAVVALGLAWTSGSPARADTKYCASGDFFGYDNGCTYSYAGDDQTFVVPTGVTELAVRVTGASGEYAALETGGRGAFVTATIPVTPGETLYIEVGGQGLDQVGGYDGGASGDGQSAGGGASDIRTMPFDGNSLASLESRLVVAGGGGGYGQPGYTGSDTTDWLGGDGGNAGAAGDPGTVNGALAPGTGGLAGAAGDDNQGLGGVPTSGTTGPTPDAAGDNGFPGTLGEGGGGSVGITGGGGGGGGYYGGGGGGGGATSSSGTLSAAGSGGGGGGSSYVEPSGLSPSFGLAPTGTAATVNGVVSVMWNNTATTSPTPTSPTATQTSPTAAPTSPTATTTPTPTTNPTTPSTTPVTVSTTASAPLSTTPTASATQSGVVAATSTETSPTASVSATAGPLPSTGAPVDEEVRWATFLLVAGAGAVVAGRVTVRRHPRGRHSRH